MTADADRPATSLLAHLANRFTNLMETLATETLGYILSQSAPARGAIQEMLASGGADVGPIARVVTEVTDIRVQTEVTDIGKGRIDLAGYNEAYEERVLIEAKFWAELTDNQPSEYLKRLPNDGRPSALLFVAPEARIESLWTEVCGRAREGKFTVDIGADTGALRTAVIAGSERRLMLTSWRAMLREMRGAAGDVTVEKDIDQLRVLCDQQDRTAFLPLRVGELGPGFSKRAINLHYLYNDVLARLQEMEELVSFDGLAAGGSKPNFGRFFHLGNRNNDAGGIADGAWFGVHYEHGAQYRETPVWVVLGLGYAEPKTAQIRERLDAAQRKTGLDVIHTNSGKWPVSLIPIHLPAGVEYEVVLDSVVGQIRKIGEILAAPQ